MPISMQMIFDDKCLRVVATGYADSVEDVVSYVEPQIGQAMERGIRRVLLDERKVAFHLDYCDTIALANYFEGKGTRRNGFRVATLISDTTPDFHRAWETVSRNRSMSYKIFDDESEAMKWLLGEAAL